MNYHLKDIAEIIKARVLGTETLSIIRHVCIDSRKVIFPSQSIFIALKGIKNDGHHYIKDAYNKGIRHFIISQEPPAYQDAVFLKVDDPLLALQKWAGFHRKKFTEVDVIAITGSYGKTTVKEWVYQMLHDEYEVVKSPKSFNSQIGVALSLLQINDTHDIAIIEAGISQKGEMERLEKMIQPNIGLLCNIGKAHASGFSSEKEKLNEKLKLFKNCDSIVIEDRLVDHVLHLDGLYLTWEYHIIKQEYNRSVVLLSISTETYTLSFPFTDDASIQNAVNAMCIAYHFDYPIEDLMFLVEDLTPVSMRLEITKGINQSIIINDAYIADLDSLEIALNLQKSESGDKKKMLLLSDFQLAEEQKKSTYLEVQNILKAFDVQTLLTIGNDLKHFIPEAINFGSKKEILAYFKKNPLENSSLLIKGSRAFQLEEISNYLSNQLNDTILEIDLTALAHNISTYHQLLNTQTEIIGVIKAGAYGSGSVKIAKALLQLNVHTLAVAFTDEGIELRDAGIDCPIIILNPQISNLDKIAFHELEPEVYSLEQLKAISAVAREYLNPISIHFNLNTGMNRLGLEPEDIIPAIDIVIQNPLLNIESVFSHLSGSDNGNHDDYSQTQFAKFEKMSGQIINAFDHKIKRHMLNSGGIPRFENHQYDAVRLGLGMYGIDTSGLMQDLEKVHLLKSKVIQIKNYPKGTSIGYNRSYVAPDHLTVATIPIGYADGLPRAAGNHNYPVLINGKKAFIIGNVCMDLIMVDITFIEDVVLGTEVIIYGKDHPIEILASKSGTIPYEVLSNMSPRLRRIFIQE